MSPVQDHTCSQRQSSEGLADVEMVGENLGCKKEVKYLFLQKSRSMCDQVVGALLKEKDVLGKTEEGSSFSRSLSHAVTL